MVNNVGIPMPPVIVTILWQRNPLSRRNPRTIIEASIIGNLTRCQNFLRPGSLLVDAEDCLERHGFRLLSEERLGVFGISVFARQG